MLQLIEINLYSCGLHVPENPDKRLFYFVIQVHEPEVFYFLPDLLSEHGGDHSLLPFGILSLFCLVGIEQGQTGFRLVLFLLLQADVEVAS